MGISKFYTEVLGANLAGVRWSWGATNSHTNQVFFRVWEDEIKTVQGVERCLLLDRDWKGKSAGFPERKRHLRLVEDGAVGYGVVCTAKDTDAPSRTIASYDDQELIRFGSFIEEGPEVFGIVAERVAVSDLARPRSATSALLPDLKAILSRRIETTEKERLANARIGQGTFRQHVLGLWDHRCCVTGVRTNNAIIASHIKPWSVSTDEERLDPYNGLPLVATLDALFDWGLISFGSSGELLVSPQLEVGDVSLLGLEGLRITRRPSAECEEYLQYHRNQRFRSRGRQ